MSLGPRSALALVLIVHELATNATKYGALSDDEGHVEVKWTVGAREHAKVFEFVWREIGGPLVVPPTRQSFGTKLIRIGLASSDGTSQIDYAPDGVVCRMTAPLSRLQERGELEGRH